NNREVHLDYLKHRKESVATLREIVKEAKISTNEINRSPLHMSLGKSESLLWTHVNPKVGNGGNVRALPNDVKGMLQTLLDLLGGITRITLPLNQVVAIVCMYGPPQKLETEEMLERFPTM
nr:hypothetical protein [Tanacetum cinerariifolium]